MLRTCETYSIPSILRPDATLGQIKSGYNKVILEDTFGALAASPFVGITTATGVLELPFLFLAHRHGYSVTDPSFCDVQPNSISSIHQRPSHSGPGG